MQIEWKEFTGSGYVNYPLETNSEMILVARKESYGWYSDIQYAKYVNDYGFDKTRNETWTHWTEFNNPE